jgi:hypothetical protein
VSAEWKRKEHASKQSVSSEATGTWHKLDTACGNTHEQLNVIGLQLTCTWPMCCSNATKGVRSTSIDHECMQSRCSRPSIQLWPDSRKPESVPGSMPGSPSKTHPLQTHKSSKNSEVSVKQFTTASWPGHNAHLLWNAADIDSLCRQHMPHNPAFAFNQTCLRCFHAWLVPQCHDATAA